MKNRTYLGETGHHGSWFPGEHKPIIDRATFDKVQELLKSNGVARTGRQQQTGALLTGILFDDRGNRMSPSFSVKGGIRYPFYISSAMRNGSKTEAGSVRRVSGTAIEGAVLTALRDNIQTNDEIAPRNVIEQHVARVVIHPKRIVITLKGGDGKIPSEIEASWHACHKSGHVQIDERNSISSNRSPDPKLVQAIVRAHAWLKMLSSGKHESIESLAIGIAMHPKVVRAKIRLAFLPPKMAKAVLTGEQPAALTLGELNRAASLAWNAIAWG